MSRSVSTAHLVVEAIYSTLSFLFVPVIVFSWQHEVVWPDSDKTALCWSAVLSSAIAPNTLDSFRFVQSSFCGYAVQWGNINHRKTQRHMGHFLQDSRTLQVYTDGIQRQNSTHSVLNRFSPPNSLESVVTMHRHWWPSSPGWWIAVEIKPLRPAKNTEDNSAQLSCLAHSADYWACCRGDVRLYSPEDLAIWPILRGCLIPKATLMYLRRLNQPISALPCCQLSLDRRMNHGFDETLMTLTAGHKVSHIVKCCFFHHWSRLWFPQKRNLFCPKLVCFPF